MLKYNYEALNEQSFQKLAQALILTQHSGTQCLPVGQPDGGRDAHFFHSESDKTGFVVFQVKFSRNPGNKDERDVIAALIKSETTKVKKLIDRGATHYYLITNVQGTSHLDVGSIDKATAILQEAFGIPSQVWWRDDLDCRLDSSLDIKMSYPEVLRASDLLPLLMKQFGCGDVLRSARALNAYIATQYNNDREIKFKQVELKRALTDLFVDLPLGHKREEDEQDRRQRGSRLSTSDVLAAYLSQLGTDDEYTMDEIHRYDHSGLAGAFLSQMPVTDGVSRFVLEGAPGQGKSTVTQFLCQVNRLRFLRKDDELKSVADAHKSGPVRVPFRLDLRDYAAWVTGKNPFSKQGEVFVPDEGRRSLEGFLATQVTWSSGNLGISQHELLEFFERSHSMIVLDGFDEVADIATRSRLVEEICEASARLDVIALSLQIIVTSRPAAFANSPGFPETDWVHLELKDLRRENIVAYKNKWTEAQQLTKPECDTVSSTLEDKLEQPHLRDLARNPMQLAILLHLIHVQGPALPEKRTTLYEEYMTLFFNREAEKSLVVRDHRDLLLSIHGVLAWVLQTQAEKGSGAGSITKEALRTEVKSYLRTEEHNENLADTLLMGSYERVGALVSRVEGTFEFEVQPLREYFAAMHLYRTAPHSPPGRPRPGTRPDRFDALARSFYWTNVTRFFCGFYDVGELGTLVDGIIQVGERDGYHLINQPRRLAMMLLSDQVFTQSPRSMRRLIKYVTQEPGFLRLTAQAAPHGIHRMALPERAGRNILFDICNCRLEAEVDSGQRRYLRRVMAQNGDDARLKSIWRHRFENRLMRCDPLLEAFNFGVITQFDSNEIEELTQDDLNLCLRWLVWLGHYDVIIQDQKLYEAACSALFNATMIFVDRGGFRKRPTHHLELLTKHLRVHALTELFSVPPDRIPAYALLERYCGVGGLDLITENPCQTGKSYLDPVARFTEFFVQHMKTNIEDWQTQLSPWSVLVDTGFDVAPSSMIFANIAVLSTATTVDQELGVWDDDGFTPTKGLVERLYFARLKSDDARWWHLQLDNCKPNCAVSSLAVLLSWGMPNTLLKLKPLINSTVDNLDANDWSNLLSLLEHIATAANSRRPQLNEKWFDNAGVLSPRAALALIFRVQDDAVQMRLSRWQFGNYRGTDRHIIQHAATWELMHSDTHQIDWDFVSHLSKLAKENDLPILIPMHRMELGDLPQDTAREILSDCESHCSQLVAICEHAYGMRVAEKATKVSEVAESDDWFAPHPE